MKRTVGTAALAGAADEAVMAIDRSTQLHDIRMLMATPEVIIVRVAAVTETGSLLAVSASGSRDPCLWGRCGPPDLGGR